jgi:hypothetical protein
VDKKFLDKVLEQIVRESIVDHEEEVVYTPFGPHYHFIYFHRSLPISEYFNIHCKDIYGLNKEEIEYVWKEYKDIVRDKIYG